MIVGKKMLTLWCAYMVCATIALAHEIHAAVQNGDIAAVKRLLDENPDLLNIRGDDGMTPLSIAAHNGNEEIVSGLLARGADISIGDMDNSQPIHYAAIGGNIQIAELLLKAGASINEKDENGAVPLHFAAGRGGPEMIRYLIERGAEVNTQDKDGITPIFWARSEETAEILIDNGANINIQSHQGITALHYAVYRGRNEMVQLLLEKGADPNIRNQQGVTPLFWARGENAPAIAQLLIEYGAQVNIRDNQNSTPLHTVASTTGSVKTAELLLSKGADINAMSDHGWTPLCNAALCNPQITQYLISKGADVNPHKAEKKDIRYCHAGYQTPLHCAVRSDSTETVKVLVKNGAMINVTDEGGMTPLHKATSSGNTEMVDYLLNKGAALNIEDERFGRKEIHTAVIKGYKDIVELLIKRGAEINMQDKDGKTPLDYARYHGFEQITILLASEAYVAKHSAVVRDLKLRSKQALIWYLGHSGWALKTKNHLLIFDYFTDTNRPLPTDASLASGHIVPDDIKEQNVTVFVTHDHGDHYDARIFEWQGGVANIEYILGFRPRDIETEYILIGPHSEQVRDDMKIATIKSNDAGVGFLVEVDGLVIFHAGDHANGFLDMSGNYTPEIDALATKSIKIDLAFFPIIGCSLGTPESVQKGVHYAIEKLNPKVLFPMHAGNNTYQYKEFVDNASKKGYTTQMAYAIDRGDRFLFKDGTITKIGGHLP